MTFTPDHVLQERLTTAPLIWLTTNSPTGQPSPRPVWFFWTGEHVVIYSRPDAAKLRHIAVQPKVSLNFNCDDVTGREVDVIAGLAAPAPDLPPLSRLPGFVGKYTERITYAGLHIPAIEAAFSTPLRVEPLRAWRL